MSEFDLLRSVQPSDGWFAVLGIKKGVIQQRLLADRAEVDEFAKAKVASGWDVYFGVAKYATPDNRLKDNVKSLKAMWLDMDCGESKAVVNPKTGRASGYIDQSAALIALKAFLKETRLPKPVVVSSGRGLHVYWPLAEEIDREQWEDTAATLQTLCVKHGLIVDPAVFEVARVLRIPGTLNFKDSPPSPVEVLISADPTPFDEFRAILGVEALKAAAPAAEQKPLSAMAQALEDGDRMACSFELLIARSKEGDGCAQMLHAVENRATLNYDMWHAALSIANKCEDRVEGIRMVSMDHPDYNQLEAEKKAASFDGPRTCARIEVLNPHGCDGCPHKDKIKSPLVLGGIQMDVARNLEVEVPGFMGAPPTTFAPDYPEPFYWSTKGGIYKRAKGEEGVSTFVYNNHLYITNRMDDPALGDVILMNLHLPKDGVRKITIPASQLNDDGEIRKTLSSRGVTCTKRQFALIIEYIQLSVNQFQKAQKADIMRTQFGWADNNTKFIVGDREITLEGTFYSPPSSATAEIAKHMTVAGSLEGWKDVFNLYGRKGLEPNAFAALTAFGAPLLRFTGQRGGMINVIHPSSGTGKTTVLHMSNSVFGHPKELTAAKIDTAYAKIQRLGIHNNIHVTYDEITNMEVKDFSELVYNTTQGRGRDRMKAGTNEMRVNNTTWATIALCSSNASFYEKLGAFKNTPDGEMMRLIEYTIDYTSAIDIALAKEKFDHQLMQNYGHAGQKYIKWLVSNQEEAEQTLRAIQAKIDAEFKLTQRERVWSALVASNIAGGLMAKSLGLIDFPLEPVYNWIGKHVQSTRDAPTSHLVGAAAIIGDFINRHIHNVLVVNDALDKRSNMPLRPVMEPSRELLIRYEPDTKKLFIVAKEFQNDCVERQINYRTTIQELKDKKIYLGGENKRMTKGMRFNAPGVYALVLDCANEEFEGMAEFVEQDIVRVGRTG